MKDRVLFKQESSFITINLYNKGKTTTKSHHRLMFIK